MIERLPPANPLRRIAVLGLLALIVGPTWLHAADKEPAWAEPPTASSPAELTPIAKDWKEFLDHADHSAVYASYTVIDQVKDADGEVSSEACREHADAIDKSLKVNPVGLALWYTAHLCAEAVGDTAAAAQRLERFEALVQHAFASRPNDFGTTPIRVVAERDAYALVAASGQEVLYSYYDKYSDPRYLSLLVGLWDAERGRERMLLFDYVDTAVRLNHTEAYAQFPLFRRTMISQLLDDAEHETSDSPTGLTARAREALKLPTAAQRVQALAEAAAEHNLLAAILVVASCMRDEALDCRSTAIDVMLPFAEQRYAPALVYLAIADTNPESSRQDRKAALALLDAADLRLGGISGRILYVVSATTTEQLAAAWRLVGKDLESAANDGDDQAAILVAMSPERGRLLFDKPLANLLRAAKAGVPYAQYLYGLELAARARFAPAAKWIELAAETDFTAAQVWLGDRLYSGKDLPANRERAVYWWARAGHGGIAAAMRLVGEEYLEKSSTPATRELAQGWLQSAGYAGDVKGALALAKLYETGQPDLDGGPGEAAKIYSEMVEQHDSAEARRRWARLLATGIGVDADRAKAESLLRADAVKNDTESQVNLGRLLLRDTDDARAAEGRDWLRKASAADNQRGSEGYAAALWYGQGGTADPVHAAALWQSLADAGDLLASNDYAWALCTRAEPAADDAAKGLALMQAPIEYDANRPAWVDTLAACQAGHGDFDAAIRTQQHAVELFNLPEMPNVATRKAVSDRLALYKAGKRYVE